MDSSARFTESNGSGTHMAEMYDAVPTIKPKGSSFQIVVRTRPTKQEIMNKKSSPILQIGDDMKNLIVGKDLPHGTRYPSYQFVFDRVFNAYTTQKLFYTKAVHPLVKVVLEKGINSTVFAYGQSRAGKSYTYEGVGSQGSQMQDPDRKGMIVRTVDDIFHYIRANATTGPFATKFTVKVTYMQIYNEVISDLLNFGSHNLRIVDKGHHSKIKLPELTTRTLREPGDIYQILKAGKVNRGVANGPKPPDLNSRASTVLSIIVEQVKPSTTRPQVLRSKINFVELASCDKARDPNMATNRFQEEGHRIAKSFNALATVIAFLKRPGHVPYRDSKLTHVLRDSLTEHSLCLFIACIYPLAENFSEILGTCKYASRIRQSASYIGRTDDSSSINTSSSMMNNTSSLRASRSMNSSSFANSTRLPSSTTINQSANQSMNQSVVNDHSGYTFSAIDEHDAAQINMQRELKRVKGECQRLFNERNNLINNIDEMKTDVNRVLDDREGLKKQLLDKEIDMKKVYNNLETSQVHMDSLRDELLNKTDNLDRLKSVQQELQKSNDRLRDEIEVIKAESHRAKQDMLKIQDEKQEILQQNLELSKLNQSTKDTAKEKEREAEHWEREYKHVESLRQQTREQLMQTEQRIQDAQEKTQHLKSTLNQRDEEIEDLKMIKRNLQKELDMKQEQVYSFKTENDDLHRQLVRSQSQSALNSSMNQNKETQMDRLLDQVRDLKADNRELEATVQELKLQSSIRGSKSVSFADTTMRSPRRSTTEPDLTTDALSSPRKSILNTSQDQQVLETRLTMLRDENDTLRENLEDSLAEIKKMQLENDALQSEMLKSEPQTNMTLRAEQLLTDKISLEKELGEKRRQIHEQYSENQHLRMDLANTKMKWQQSVSQVTMLEHRVQPLEETKAKLNELILALQDRDATIDDLSESMMALEESRQQLTQTEKQQRDHIDNLTMELDETKHKLQSIQREKDILQDTLTRFKTDQSSYETSVQHDMDDMTSQLSHILSQYKQTQESLHQTQQAKEALEKSTAQEIESLKQQRDTLSNELAAYEKKVEAIRATTDSVVEENQHLAKQLDDERDQVQDLSNEKASLEDQVNELRSQFLKVKEESNAIRSQLFKATQEEMNTSTALDRLRDVLESPKRTKRRPTNADELTDIVSEVHMINENTKRVWERAEEITKELALVSNEKSRLRTELDQAQQSNTLLRDEVHLLERSGESLKSEKQVLEQDRDAMHKKYQESRATIHSLELQHASLQSHLADVEHDKKAAESKVTSLDSQLSHANEEFDRYQSEKLKELEELNNNLRHVRQESLLLSQELDNVRMELNEKHHVVNERDATITNLEDSMLSLELKLTTANDANDSLKQQQTSLESKLKHLEDTLEDYVSQQQTTEATLKKSYEENQHLVVANSEYKLEVHTLKEKVASLEKDLDIRRGVLREKEDEIDRLSTKLKQADTEHRYALAALQRKHDGLAHTLSTSNANEEKTARHLQDSVAEYRTLKQQYETLEGTLAETRETLSVKQQALASTQTELTASKDEVALCQSRLRDLKRDLDKVNRSLSSLQNERDQLSSSLSSSNKDNSSCRQELRSLKDANAELGHRCRDATKEVEHLMTKLGDYRAELDKMKHERDLMHQKLVQSQDLSNQFLHEKQDLHKQLLSVEETLNDQSTKSSRLAVEVAEQEQLLRRSESELSRMQHMQSQLKDSQDAEDQLKKSLSNQSQQLQQLRLKTSTLEDELREKDVELHRVRIASEKTNRDLKNIISSFGI